MKKIFYITLFLLSLIINSVFASSYELNGDKAKSGANETIETTSLVLYVIFGILIAFGGYLIFSNKNPRYGKILIILSVLSLFAIKLISGMLLVFNSSSI